MSEEGATRKHLATRSWKLVRNVDINIFSPVSTAVDSVENLYSLDSDCFAIVDGNPWCSFIEVCVAHVYSISIIRALCISINALGC